MSTLYTQAESNIRKTWLYFTGFFIFIIGLGWLISYFFENSLILLVIAILSSLMSFFSYWYSDKVVLSISRAKEIKKEDNPELYRIVENLCISAGLPFPKIYIINESQPNAFATGRDPKHSAVAVTKGLLEKLERSELEGVIAHELSHIGNRDILLITIAVVLVGLVVRMTNFFFRFSFWGRDFTWQEGEKNDHRERLRFIMMIFSLLLFILAPLFAIFIKLAISRKREFLADASGALLTRYPEGLIRALEKISQDPEPLRIANDTTAPLYIASPFRGKEKTSWYYKLLMTHPPIEERIKALRNMEI